MWNRVGAAAACFAAIMGFSRLAYGVLVPPMAHALGGSYALYGAIGSANFVGYLLGTLVATRLAGRVDRARSNTIALLAMCATMGACGLVHDTAVLGILRFLVGIASGSALALTLSLAVEGIPADRRGVAASIVWGGGALGIAIVGAMGFALPLGAPNAWRIVWIAMALAGVASTVVFARIAVDAPRPGEPAAAVDDGTPLGLFASGRYLTLTVAYFLYGAGYIDIVTFFGAALGHARALPASAAWLVLGTAGLVGVALWGPLVDRLRSGLPVAWACAASAFGAAAVASGESTLALVGALSIGVSFIGVPAMVGALVQQRESRATYARAFASITVVLGMGQIVGPTLGGLVADRFGAPGALLVGAALCALAAGFASAYRVREAGTCATRGRRLAASTHA